MSIAIVKQMFRTPAPRARFNPHPSKRPMDHTKPLAETTPKEMIDHIVYGHLVVPEIAMAPAIASWDIMACRHLGIRLDGVVRRILKDLRQPDAFFLDCLLPGGHYLEDPALPKTGLIKNLRFIDWSQTTSPAIDWKAIWAEAERLFPGASKIEIVDRDLKGVFGIQRDYYEPKN